MPTYSIELDVDRRGDLSAEPPITIPVFHNGRKIALAFFEHANYSFDLPNSLSYLVQMGGAVPTLFYSKRDGSLSDIDQEGTEPASVVLVPLAPVPQHGSRMKLRTVTMRP